MAADTPTVFPSIGAGIRPDDVLQFCKSPYSGAGTQREGRWQIAKVTVFPATGVDLIFDSLLRENDDRAQGDDWIDVETALIPLVPSTTYYVSCMVRNTSSESSSWATAVSFVTMAGETTLAVWRAGQ